MATGRSTCIHMRPSALNVPSTMFMRSRGSTGRCGKGTRYKVQGTRYKVQGYKIQGTRKAQETRNKGRIALHLFLVPCALCLVTCYLFLVINATCSLS